VTIIQRRQERNGTAAQWTAANPVLAAAEIGVETDTLKFKIGNGTTVWTALVYAGFVADGSVTPAKLSFDPATQAELDAARAADAATQSATYLPKSVLTTDGDVLSRAAGVPVRLTRAALAADAAFGTVYASAVSPWPVQVGGLAANGTTDDTTALANAMANAPSGATLRLPNKNILIAGTIPDLGAKTLTLEGQGWYSPVVALFGDSQYLSLDAGQFDGTRLKFGGAGLVGSQVSGKLQLKNLMMTGPGTGASVGLVLGSQADGPGIAAGIIENVLIANFATCFSCNTQEWLFSFLHVRGGHTGILHLGASNNNQFDLLTVQRMDVYGVDHQAGSLNLYNAPLFQANTGVSLNIKGNGAQGNHFVDPWFENIGGTKAINIEPAAGPGGGSSGGYTCFDGALLGATGKDIATINATGVMFRNPTSMQTVDLTGSYGFFGYGQFGGMLTNIPPSSMIMDISSPQAIFPGRVGNQVEIDLSARAQAVVGAWTTVNNGGLFMGYNSTGALNDSATFQAYFPAGTYQLDLIGDRAPDSAIVTVKIDGAAACTTDLYNAIEVNARSGGSTTFAVSGGWHTVSFTALSQNASSSGYLMRMARAVFTKTL